MHFFVHLKNFVWEEEIYIGRNFLPIPRSQTQEKAETLEFTDLWGFRLDSVCLDPMEIWFKR